LSEKESLAVIDLQRYLGQVTGETPILLTAGEWKNNPAPAVLIGTPDNNSLIRVDTKSLGDQGYRLESITMKRQPVVIASGKTSQGAVNAVYGLLRELGFRFYMGSEAIPEHLPPGLPVSPVIKQPALQVRGVLPWYNFFNSPTTWDPVDHRTFADQLIRSGANFLGFHSYDFEPFAAYFEDDKAHWGRRLLNTSSPTWGTHALKTTSFPYDINKLFPHDYFGAATTRLEADQEEVIRIEQNLMRDALDYASRRGLYTCLGFEINGDPTNPEMRQAFLKRLNHILDQYPALDMVWLWQSETQGVQGFAPKYNLHVLPYALKGESPLNYYAMDRREIFKRIVEREEGEQVFLVKTEMGKSSRAAEGARLEQFAQLALNTLANRETPPRLILSGWGGDERLLSAEYYEGLDKILPEDVIFASLDHINPRERVDTIYHELPSGRERWPIPWLELDGDMWQPQSFVHIYEKMMRDIHQGGSQGALGIHWRTRELEENFAYLVDFAWNPGLTAKEFFKDLAMHCYSPDISARMASIHYRLDQLGYRWVGGGGQNECAPFTWGPGEEEKVGKLKAIREEIQAFLPEAGKGKARLEWLLDRIDWVLNYDKTQRTALEVKKLLDKAGSLEQPEQKKSLARLGLDLLEDGDMARALHAYARRVSTRGEYGVLATINTKAWVDWKNIREKCLQILDSPDRPLPEIPWEDPVELILPRHLGSVPAGEDLELKPYVVGENRKVWGHYRRIGTNRWTTVPLESVRGWVKRMVIPGEKIIQPGLEVAFSFQPEISLSPELGPLAITVMPNLQPETEPLSLKTFQVSQDIRVEAGKGQATPVRLEWTEIPQAIFYRVYRNDKMVAETSVPFFPDVPGKTENQYRVEAISLNGETLTEGRTEEIVLNDLPLPEKPELNTQVNSDAVVIYWPAVRNVSYKLERRPADKPDQRWDMLAEVSSKGGLDHVHQDKPPEGRWTYRLTPFNGLGQAGPAAGMTVCYPAKEILAKKFPLTSLPEQAKKHGEVTFTPEGAVFNGGHLTIPHQDWMNLERGFTLDFEFKFDELGGMPVLLCHGIWNSGGWFVQVLGGKLIVRLPGADAQGPEIKVNQWYKARFVFDGSHAHLAVNGEWIPQDGTEVNPLPLEQSLFIGNYTYTGNPYVFDGIMRNVRFVRDVLMD
jgi:hypothetical protein